MIKVTDHMDLKQKTSYISIKVGLYHLCNSPNWHITMNKINTINICARRLGFMITGHWFNKQIYPLKLETKKAL